MFWVGREFTLHKFHVWCCRCAKLGVVYSYLHAAACASLPLFTISKSVSGSANQSQDQPRQTVRTEYFRSTKGRICIPPEPMSIELDGLSRQIPNFFQNSPTFGAAKVRLARRDGIGISRYAAASRAARRRARAPTTRRRYHGAIVVVFIGLAWVRTVSRRLSSASSSSGLPAKSPVPLIICG